MASVLNITVKPMPVTQTIDHIVNTYKVDGWNGVAFLTESDYKASVRFTFKDDSVVIFVVTFDEDLLAEGEDVFKKLMMKLNRIDPVKYEREQFKKKQKK